MLLNAPSPTELNQVWVADITYVPLMSQKFLYLALLMDLFSRKLIGWDLQNHMREPLVLAALRTALSQRTIKPGLIHHSDRGGQYAGIRYRKRLLGTAMMQSMSRAKNCYDNAFMESCFGTVKAELEMTNYANEAIARKAISAYIRYYNVRRRHASLGYLSPESFEQQRRRN